MSVGIYRNGNHLGDVDEIDIVGSITATLAASGDRVILAPARAIVLGRVTVELGRATIDSAAVDGAWTTIDVTAANMNDVEDSDGIEIDIFESAATDASRFTVQMSGRMFNSLPTLASAPTGTDAPDGILEQRVPRLFENSSGGFAHSQAFIGRDATHIYFAHAHASEILDAPIIAYRTP